MLIPVFALGRAQACLDSDTNIPTTSFILIVTSGAVHSAGDVLGAQQHQSARLLFCRHVGTRALCFQITHECAIHITRQGGEYYKLFIGWTNEKIKQSFVHRNMFEYHHIKTFDRAYVELNRNNNGEIQTAMRITPGRWCCLPRPACCTQDFLSLCSKSGRRIPTTWFSSLES